jgi:hypothetical protein
MEKFRVSLEAFLLCIYSNLNLNFDFQDCNLIRSFLRA